MAGSGDKYRGSSTSNGVGVRTGDHSKPVYESEERRKRVGPSSSHGHKTEYLVTKIEQTVCSVIGDKHRHKSPAKFEHRNGDRWRKPTSPVRNRPHKVDELITRVQNEASRIKPKFTPVSPSHWRPKTRNHGDDLGNKLGHNSDGLENKQPPSLIDTDGWTRPNKAMWASPPDDGSLFKQTKDNGQAPEYLKGAATKTGDTGKRDGYGGETIDSREAQRRYGNAKLPAWRVDPDARTIDSRKAEKKYGGTRV